MAKNALKLLKNRLPKFKVAIEDLTNKEVLAGIPQETTTRNDENTGMNNATIAYVQDNGSPAANIPARPFMEPGVQDAKPQVIKHAKFAAKTAFRGSKEVDDSLHAMGLVTASAIKKRINDGIPPPLAPSTVANRYRQRGTAKRRKAETAYLDLISSGAQAAGMSLHEIQAQAGIKPLVNTAQMRNAITYAVRKRKRK